MILKSYQAKSISATVMIAYTLFRYLPSVASAYVSIPVRQLFHRRTFLSLSNAESNRYRYNLSQRYSSSQTTVIDYSNNSDMSSQVVNLLTIELPELEVLMVSWGHPKYRAQQVLNWVREKGVLDVDAMHNIPKGLKSDLKRYAKIGGALKLAVENISKDGTRKRAYTLHDGQLIESVLMPYEDGRNTACISSQAGCAMGCVFCATGQMGFARQLSPDEIFEQVARFASELKAEDKRLSNVVFMGMGEPLANYRNVMEAVKRIGNDLGIGARKITISTVGLTPNIRKLIEEDAPQVRLAVSLHCADDEERSKLLPANKRYGGLEELMTTVRDYTERTKRRMTFEWALIEGQNDTPIAARQLGNLIKTYDIRSDMVHINLIPLNPTGGFGGSPSGRARVDSFVKVLESEFNLSATPRVRRGIDIDAGCGQLKAKIQKHESESSISSITMPQLPAEVGVYEDNDGDEGLMDEMDNLVTFDFDDDDFEDPVFETEMELAEVTRLIEVVKASFPAPKDNNKESDTNQLKNTSITDEDALREAKKRRKKLKKNLKAIDHLKEKARAGSILNDEQQEKLNKETEWIAELESVEHNLK